MKLIVTFLATLTAFKVAERVVEREEYAKCAYDPERDDFKGGDFPADFKWSLATAAYQIEGSHEADGKGENIWDKFSNAQDVDGVQGSGKCNVAGCDTGNNACESYKNTERDIQLLKDMGIKYYRFSFSWSRILPKGSGEVNQAGINHYSKFIDDLIAAGIIPQVTLYHWDLPQPLEDKYGGWVDKQIVDDFVAYAKVCFENFGDRVKFWITLNEAEIVADLGYGIGVFAPGIKDKMWPARHNTVLAHVRTYDLYNREFKTSQKGECGITMNTDWYEPATDSDGDKLAAQNQMDSQLGFWADPIYTDRKDYPASVRTAAGADLPEFSNEEKALLGNAADFFGLNHYTSRMHAEGVDGGIVCSTWPTSGSDWLLSVPWGHRFLLNYIHETYDSDKYPIYVTENGISSAGNGTDLEPELNDTWRSIHYRNYIGQMQRAIVEDGVNVVAYTAWSLMDNFEWASGYYERFGVNWVNFTDPERPVYRKESSSYYQELARRNNVESSDEAPKSLPDKCYYNAERDEFTGGEFPADFKWSLATAAYQIEGSHEAEGKGENIWDKFSNAQNVGGVEGKCNVANCETGNNACESYTNTERDIQLIKDMGIKNYRFSFSWSRILPKGSGEVNPEGIAHYSKFIDDLIDAGITPMVTLYHWDLPQPLEDAYGGWVDKQVVDDFVEYARVCFENFGDRVKFWITLNEAEIVADLGYGIGVFAPGVLDKMWPARHHTVLAHVKTYDLYKNEFKVAQKGVCGITMNTDWYEPATDSDGDKLAAQNQMDSQLGFWADPIYTDRKDYPDSVRAAAGNDLPQFTTEEKAMLGDAADFFGLNHYTSRLYMDGGKEYRCETWPTSGSEWLLSVPWGHRYLLNYIHETYDSNKYPIYVTENGISSAGNGTDAAPALDDTWRSTHYRNYIGQMHRAIQDGVNVKAYTAWSLMDNFEWASGYYERFGVNWVNFTAPERPVYRKESGKWFQNVAENNKVEGSDEDVWIPESTTTQAATTDSANLAGLSFCIIFFSAFLM